MAEEDEVVIDLAEKDDNRDSDSAFSSSDCYIYEEDAVTNVEIRKDIAEVNTFENISDVELLEEGTLPEFMNQSIVVTIDETPDQIIEHYKTAGLDLNEESSTA